MCVCVCVCVSGVCNQTLRCQRTVVIRGGLDRVRIEPAPKRQPDQSWPSIYLRFNLSAPSLADGATTHWKDTRHHSIRGKVLLESEAEERCAAEKERNSQKTGRGRCT